MRIWASPIAIRSFRADIIMTSALFQGRPGDPAAILADMDRITAAREASQPIREKTGGSTFANRSARRARSSRPGK